MSVRYRDIGLSRGPIEHREKLWACGLYLRGSHIGCVFRHRGQTARFLPTPAWNFRPMRIEEERPSWCVDAVMARIASQIRESQIRVSQEVA